MDTVMVQRSDETRGLEIVLCSAGGDFLGGVGIGIAIAELICRIFF